MISHDCTISYHTLPFPFSALKQIPLERNILNPSSHFPPHIAVVVFQSSLVKFPQLNLTEPDLEKMTNTVPDTYQRLLTLLEQSLLIKRLFPLAFY